LGRGWGRGTGPHALLAAPPGELHDLGLVALGLALRDRGWRVTFLGADTPIDTLSDTAAGVRPTLVVLASVMPSRTGAVTEAVASLARRWPVVLAGDGVSEELAARIGARFLTADPIEAAELLASSSVAAVA
jgi:methanogenic corrinoid protein MtbC1